MQDLYFNPVGLPYHVTIKEGELNYKDLVNNAYASLSIGQRGRALEYSEEAIKMCPKEPDGYGIKGIVSLEVGNVTTANTYFSKAIEIFEKIEGLVMDCKDHKDVFKIKEYDIEKYNRLDTLDDYYGDINYKRIILMNLTKAKAHFKKLLALTT